MTQNQIRFQEHLEAKRHNQRTEGQTDVQLAETGRHNRVTEAETERHNREDESIRYQANDITNAHYQRQDAETKRHNTSQESISRYQAGASYAAADASRYAAGLQFSSAMSNLAEQSRHNEVLEGLQVRQQDTNLLSAISQSDLNRAKIDSEYVRQAESEARTGLLNQQKETETVKTISSGFTFLDSVVNAALSIGRD